MTTGLILLLIVLFICVETMKPRADFRMELTGDYQVHAIATIPVPIIRHDKDTFYNIIRKAGEDLGLELVKYAWKRAKRFDSL